MLGNKPKLNNCKIFLTKFARAIIEKYVFEIKFSYKLTKSYAFIDTKC